MFNRDLIRGSLVSLCLSSGFPSAQQTWLSLLFGKLGTCIMQKWGFLAPYTHAQFTNFYFFFTIYYFLLHYEWQIRLYLLYRSYNYCFDVSVLLIRRNSLLLTYSLTYINAFILAYWTHVSYQEQMLLNADFKFL